MDDVDEQEPEQRTGSFWAPDSGPPRDNWRRARGYGALLGDAVDVTTRLVEDTHMDVVDRTYGYLKQVPAVAGPSRIVGAAQRGMTQAVYTLVRTTGKAVSAATQLALRAAESAAQGPASGGEEHRMIAGDPPRQARQAEGPLLGVVDGVVNGLYGDYLRARNNPLAYETELYHGGLRLPVERSELARALPTATGRLVVFLHGLACNEQFFELDSRVRGDETVTRATVDFGQRLMADLQFTPCYVRYNSGLPIADNGRKLAERLEALMLAYPVPVTQLVLIGHSMGGLVARSAVENGKRRGATFVGVLTHVFCLGSPHLGAPLERAVATAERALGVVKTAATQVISKVLSARSAGIRDLYDGRVDQCDSVSTARPLTAWVQEADPARWANRICYVFIAATITRDPTHPVGRILGDLLVPEASASGRDRSQQRTISCQESVVIGGVSHLRLVHDPNVYAFIRRVLQQQLPELESRT